MFLRISLPTFASLIFISVIAAGPSLHLARKARSIEEENGKNVIKRSVEIAETQFRLPLNIVPSSYDIHIVPILDEGVENFERWSAHGSVKIQVTCLSETRRITLHSTGIDVQQQDIKVLDGQQELRVNGTELDETNEFFHVDLENPLESSKVYVIEMTKYVAKVRDTTTESLKLGLYRAEYTDFEGNQKWLATTQFATIGFRRFCPGFDEPDLKATFTLHIGRGPAYNSATNSELDMEAVDPVAPVLPSGWEWDHFKPTVVMPSYLVALVVSDFVRENSTDPYPKPVSVLGPPHLIADHHGGVLAAEISAKMLQSFDNLFGIAYSMHKMDSVAIPRNYFSFGAMENWGLVIYRDDRLLYYPGLSTEDTRYRISSILSHELAHQWFGNLVTNKWWSQVWLNEGFATYLSYIGVSEVNPEYEAEKRIVYDAVQYALAYDSGPLSHPIINTATQQQVATMSIFDGISYQKGAGLIRMMEGFLGKDVLINGLQLYLTNMSSKGAEQDDLFRQLEEVATDLLPTGKTIKSIMDTWTLKKGFPLIRVQRGNTNNTIYISQEKYNHNSNSNSDQDSNELWEVPIAIASAAELGSVNTFKPKIWLNKDIALTPYRTENLDTSQLLLVNPNVHGFYRVLYDSHFARLIQNQLETNHMVIPSVNRGQLFDDYFRFAEEGYASYESAFAFTKYLEKETDHAAWTPLLATLAKMLPYFMGSTLGFFEPFKNYFSLKFGSALELMGWDQTADEHGAMTILRANLLDWACTLENEKCKEIASNHLATWMSSPEINPIPVDLQNALYCTAVAFGNEDVFGFFLKKYTDSLSNYHDIDTETIRLVFALTCSQNTTSLSSLVNGTIDGSLVHKSHMRIVLEHVGTNPKGRDIVYTALKDQWRSISEYMGGPGNPNPQIIADVVSTLAAFQNSAGEAEKVTAIVEKMLIEDTESLNKILPQLGMAIQNIGANGQWLFNHGSAIRVWFERNVL